MTVQNAHPSIAKKLDLQEHSPVGEGGPQRFSKKRACEAFLGFATAVVEAAVNKSSTIPPSSRSE